MMKYFPEICAFSNALKLLTHLVYVSVEETTIGIKMLILALSFPHNLMGNLPLQIHEKLQHVIVGLSWKHDFSRIQLVKSCPRTPKINSKIVFKAHDHLRRRLSKLSNEKTYDWSYTWCSISTIPCKTTQYLQCVQKRRS